MHILTALCARLCALDWTVTKMRRHDGVQRSAVFSALCMLLALLALVHCASVCVFVVFLRSCSIRMCSTCLVLTVLEWGDLEYKGCSVATVAPHPAVRHKVVRAQKKSLLNAGSVRKIQGMTARDPLIEEGVRLG